jgi:hypothetical protein
LLVFACDASSLSENRQKRNDLLRFPARFHHPAAEKKAIFLNVVQNAILQFLYGVL